MPVVATIDLIPYALTSVAQVERIYSTAAVEVRTDDEIDPAANLGMIHEIINFSSETMFAYLLSFYNISDLLTVGWVNRRCAYIACYYLSRRRADAPQFVDEVKRIIEELELVRDAKIMIPGDDGLPVPQTAARIPAISSYRIDDRYLINKQRVVGSQSTEPYPGQQKYDIPGLSGDFL